MYPLIRTIYNSSPFLKNLFPNTSKPLLKVKQVEATEELKKENETTQETLDTVIQKIAALRLDTPRQHANIDTMCEKILKRYHVVCKENETVPAEVRDALIGFSRQANEQSQLPQLIEWMNQSPYPQHSVDSCSFAISRNEEALRILTFFESKDIQDPQQVAQCIRSFPYFYEEKTSRLAHLLSSYLERTQCAQLPMILDILLEKPDDNRANVVITLVEHASVVDYIRLGLSFSIVKQEIKKQALYSILTHPNQIYHEYFLDAITALLRVDQSVNFLTSIFQGIDPSFLEIRLLCLLEMLGRSENQTEKQTFYRLLQIILKNRRLVDLLNQKNQNRELADLNLYNTVIETYCWPISRTHSSIKQKIEKHLFNPLLYKYIPDFLVTKDSHILEKHLRIFFHLIDNLESGSDLVEQVDTLEVHFENVTRLLQMLGGCFSSKELCDGQLFHFLNLVLDVLEKALNVGGSNKKKLEIADQLLNTFLDVKIDHIESFRSKKRIKPLFSLIEQFQQSLSSETALMTEVEDKVSSFSKSFFHFFFKLLYSDDDFKTWCVNENPHIPRIEIQQALSGMQSKRSQLEREWGAVLNTKDFKTLHNNQVGAISLFEKIQTHNLFLKIPTGQGKALMAAIAAIELLNSRQVNQVFVFTTYSHLAKRDQESLQFLVEAAGYQSIYLSDKTNFFSLETHKKKAQIVYMDCKDFLVLLTRNIEACLLHNHNPADFIDFFFNQHDKGVVGDEFDLLTLDNKLSRYIGDFSSLFLQEKLVMQANQMAFEEKIGRSFIQTLNTRFNGAFSRWYNRQASNTQAPSTSTNQASGKQEHHAASLAYRLAQGEYTFCPHLFNFLSICRSFKHVLALSGSLNSEHMTAYRDFFSNGRPNLFVNVPPFFGSHNTSRNLKIRTESDNLSLDDWHAKILEDIQTSIEHQQPILLFGSDENQLNQINQIIADSGLLQSGYRCITITNEHDLEKHFSEIGALKTIVLSTAICGRGIDIKVSKAIVAGLHVLIIEEPESDRLITQMIGRTARNGLPGSVSLIFTTNHQAFKQKALVQMQKNLKEDRKLNIRDKEMTLSLDFFNRLSGLHQNRRKPSDASLASYTKKWILFVELVSSGSIELEQEQEFMKARQVVQEIFA